MHEINDPPRNVMIAAVFCAIIGLIAYAGYLQSGWARNAIANDIRQAVTVGQKAPTNSREAAR